MPRSRRWRAVCWDGIRRVRSLRSRSCPPSVFAPCGREAFRGPPSAVRAGARVCGPCRVRGGGGRCAGTGCGPCSLPAVAKRSAVRVRSLRSRSVPRSAVRGPCWRSSLRSMPRSRRRRAVCWNGMRRPCSLPTVAKRSAVRRPRSALALESAVHAVFAPFGREAFRRPPSAVRASARVCGPCRVRGGGGRCAGTGCAVRVRSLRSRSVPRSAVRACARVDGGRRRSRRLAIGPLAGAERSSSRDSPNPASAAVGRSPLAQ